MTRLSSEPSVDVLAAQVRAGWNEGAVVKAIGALDALVARVTEAEAALESAKDFSYRSHRDRAERAEAALADARNALERIAAQQPETLATLRQHGIVFDGPLGADPKNWQHVAFSIYTDLCEVDSWAREVLVRLDGSQP